MAVRHYYTYVHGSKDSAVEAARDAGFTEEEIEKHGLAYVGYEIRIKVTVDDSKESFVEEMA